MINVLKMWIRNKGEMEMAELAKIIFGGLVLIALLIGVYFLGKKMLG